MSKKVTTEDFIRRGREVHGDKYDYSKAVYVAAKADVTIICPIHGEFRQRPANHYIGHGCHECGGNKPLTFEKFLQRARDKHGNKYDYSLVSFKNTDAKVDIICPEHGVFDQYVLAHLKGFGCQRCGWDSATTKRSMTTEQFIKQATLTHSGKFDYSKTKYVNANQKVTITCPVHGDFTQHAYNHILGIGCSKCSDIAGGEKRRKTTEEFIAMAVSIHGNKYDYSLVEYTTSTDKVQIVCSEHGVFWQSASNHVNPLIRTGCPGCALSGFDQTKPGILYYLAVLTDAGETLYKVGITNKSVQHRFPNIDLARIRTLKTWYFEAGFDAAKRESELLHEFAGSRYYGPDVLTGSGNTELFVSDILGLDNEEQIKHHSQWEQSRLDF